MLCTDELEGIETGGKEWQMSCLQSDYTDMGHKARENQLKELGLQDKMEAMKVELSWGC